MSEDVYPSDPQFQISRAAAVRVFLTYVRTSRFARNRPSRGEWKIMNGMARWDSARAATKRNLHRKKRLFPFLKFGFYKDYLCIPHPYGENKTRMHVLVMSERERQIYRNFTLFKLA